MHAYTKKKNNSQRFFILPTSTYIIEDLREKQIGSNVVYILIIMSLLIFLRKDTAFHRFLRNYSCQIMIIMLNFFDGVLAHACIHYLQTKMRLAI